jgi:hypothetical protein
MKSNRRRWIKWLLVGAGLAILVPLAAYGAIILVISWLFSSSEVGFGIPQDCPGVQIMVSGEVRDPSGQPINGAYIEMHKSTTHSDDTLEASFTTDGDGHFQTEKPFSIFLCDNLYFEVWAGGSGIYRGGYERIHLTYSLAENYGEIFFPPQPVPLRFIFTLVEKIDVAEEAD